MPWEPLSGRTNKLGSGWAKRRIDVLELHRDYMLCWKNALQCRTAEGHKQNFEDFKYTSNLAVSRSNIKPELEAEFAVGCP